MLRYGRLAAVAVVLVAALSAASAHAATPWTGLPGLNAGAGAQWLRAFAFDASMTQGYAGFEDQGVFRSQTGPLGPWTPFSGGLNTIHAKRVRALHVDPTGKVYAGTEQGIFTSTGGSNWEPLAQGDEEDPAKPKKLNQSIESILVPVPGTILAGTFANGVWKSTDGGQTWQPPKPGNGMPLGVTVGPGMAAHPFTAGMVFAPTSGGIYRSTDMGSTWQLISDGISLGATPNIMFVDRESPLIYYAATVSGGIYRTTNAGFTWSAVNDGFSGGVDPIRGLQIFTGPAGATLYAGGYNGAWYATTDHDVQPAPPSWKKITNDGLAGGIMWALTAPSAAAPLLLAGTQDNGGYVRALEPPDSPGCPNDQPSEGATDADCPDIDGTVKEGQMLTVDSGTWTGTPDIDFDYQWQRCTDATPGSCNDITGETATEYGPISESDGTNGRRYRVKVTATNAFPTFDQVVRYSALSGAAITAVGIPGDNNFTIPSIEVVAEPDSAHPDVGDTLRAHGWVFDPLATLGVRFQWLRCAITTGAACEPIEGATSQEYKLVTADGQRSLRVIVTGRNTAGSRELRSDNSYDVVSEPARATVAPALVGSAYVGESLVGNVGEWADPTTVFQRRWDRCDSNGCSPIQELETGDPEHGPSYTIRAGDVGYTLRMRVIADVNNDLTDGEAPFAVEVSTPQSEIVSERPPPETPGGGGEPGGGTPGGGTPGGGTPGVGLPDLIAPQISALSVSNKRFALGPKATAISAAAKRGTTFRFRLSEPATVTITLQRLLPGRKVGRSCKPQTRKNRSRPKCTFARAAGKLTRRGLAAGANAVAFSGRVGRTRLASGKYRATLGAVDAAGNRSRPASVTFTIVKR